jgi:hypothetical protein
MKISAHVGLFCTLCFLAPFSHAEEVYVIRDRSRRVIGLRKANHKDAMSYVDQA